MKTIKGLAVISAMGEHQEPGEEYDPGPIKRPTDFGFSIPSGPHLPDFLTLSKHQKRGQGVVARIGLKQ